LRGRTHLKKIERALIGRNIPYAVTGGVGYYQTQEVFDFLNYFKFLLNPHDDVALFGILRSPFFAVADAELFEASLVNREDPLWEKVGRISPKSRNLEFAITTLNSDLRSAHTLPVPALIQRIVHRTAWNGTVAALHQGRQIRGNVEKLIELARDFEAQGYVMLYDFVQRLLGLIRSEEKEAQAVVESGNDAVRITTIHSAKGLEFPVVFVPFLNSRIKFDSEFFLEPGVGAAFPVKRPDDYDEKFPTPFGNFLGMIRRRKTLDEEKRIFYVACSRARDMLVLSGTQSDSRKGPSWLRWLMDAIPIGEESFRNGFLSFQESLTYLEKEGSHYVARTSPAELRIALMTPGVPDGSEASRSGASEPLAGAARFFLDAPVGQTAGEFFSATHLRTYRECPAKYFLKIRLGLPEEPALSPPFDAEEDPNDFLPGELEGTITHGVLQLLTSLTVDEAELREKARSLVSASAALAEHDLDAMGSKIVSWVVSFARSPIGTEVLQGVEYRTEHTLSASLGESFLTGTIDRLWKGEEGAWSFLDYKTDNVPLAELGRRGEGYLPQMEVYAYLVSRFFRQERVRAVLVFLRHPESPVEVIFDSARLRKVESDIRETIASIREGKFFDVDETCSGCPYLRGERCLISIVNKMP
jgi:ATP-dependent helicase/nuclease subunit A